MKPLHTVRLLAVAALATSAACSGEDSPNESGKASGGTTSTTATSGGPTTSAAASSGTGPGAGPTTNMTAAANSTGNATTNATSATTGGIGGRDFTSSTSAGGPSTSGTGGASSSSSSSGGSGGGGGASAVWPCPAGITGTPTLGTPTRVAAVPPADSFNMNNGTFGNVEGPVWIDDALYLSEMSADSYSQSSPDQKKSRILKLSGDSVSIFIEDSGSNGLAISLTGDLLAAVHKDGTISQFSLPDGAPTVLASEYDGVRFSSPNDLAVRADGTIYFSDPSFNAPSPPPQAQTSVYRLPVGGQPEPIPDAENPDVFNNPNGVTLSLAEDYLYVAASTGRRYPVMDDGTLGAGEDFAAANGGDGMAIDCAGNLYVTKANSSNVEVYTPDGDSIGTIAVPGFQAVTNAAFGGADHQTLYITGLGNDKGLFKLELDIPGRPY